MLPTMSFGSELCTIRRGVEVPSSPESTDPDRAGELWEVSAELVGLPAD